MPGNDDLEKVLTATMRASFGDGRVWRDPVDDTNTCSWRPRATSTRRSSCARPTCPTEVQPVAYDAADRLEPGLRGGTVYTDDRAPVEWLIDASLAEVAE